ncbi:MAG: hypothetical protein FWC89_00515 [Defluviitaleaceae bacterium]|nr:hypothetical protein [Defluviitaleaceae bacterium]
MKKNEIFAGFKSVFILALAALAVLQLSQLWLVNLTNRSFFMYLQARFPPAAPDGQGAWARPFRVVFGDGYFDMRYSGIADSWEWEFGERVLVAVLQDGDFVGSGEVDMSRVLSRAVLVYEYAFPMCAEQFAQALGRRNGALLTDAGIGTFSSVAIQPPCEGDNALRVFFMDDIYMWEFVLPFNRRHVLEDFVVSIPPANPLRLHFVATDDGFLPVAENGFAYFTIVAENPFRDANGMLTITSMRGQVESFFGNPATIIPGVSADGILTFSNINTMVRYLENDVLEYASFRTIGRTTQQNLMVDFSAALAFVLDDPHVTNEVFLRNYEQRGRENVFWFDYVIDNHPLILEEEWPTRPHCTDPLRAPIEVVVDHGRVVRYRRIVYTFRTSSTLTWKNAVEYDEFFTLGFPIGEGPDIGLEMLVEVGNGMGAR